MLLNRSPMHSKERACCIMQYIVWISLRYRGRTRVYGPRWARQMLHHHQETILPLFLYADNIMATSQAIKVNSYKMKEMKKTGVQYVTCLITSAFLDQDDPMELYFSNIQDLRESGGR